MKTPADVIVFLESTDSRLSKEDIIQKAWDLKIYDFFVGARLTFDKLITFGLAKIPYIEEAEVSSGPEIGALKWNDFAKFADQLRNRSLTGNAARKAVLDMANSCSTYEWNNWYSRILRKDLKAGVSETTINKILEKNGNVAKQFIVPVFSCQLAKDDSTKVNGIKLLDIKLDGGRLLTIFNKEDNSVRQYSRNGLLNENFPQLTTALSSLLPKLSESIVLDGEVVSKSFQELMSQFNRKKDVDTSDASYALFDIIPLKDFLTGLYNVPQKDRHLSLCELEPLLKQATNGLVYVLPKTEINLDTDDGKRQFEKFNREAIEFGYEGVMVKDPNAPYKCKKGTNWVKIKPFISCDLKIVEIVKGEPGTKYENTMGAVVFDGIDYDKPIRVSVGSGWSDKLRDDMWKYRDELIGRICEIHGDCLTQNIDNKNIWSIRFPRFERFRGWVPGEKF